MEIYSKEYKILSSDVDAFRRVRVSKLFTFMQEAAIAHTEILGAGRAKTLDRGFLWVVTMQHAEISRLPEYDETVKLVSWAGKTMHVMFPRFYELYAKDGTILAKGSAIWMLINMKDRTMVFPDAEGIAINGTVVGREYPLPKPIKALESSLAFSFTVPYSYTDLNGHLTNTKYFDLLEDNTANVSLGRSPKYVAAEYSGEARLGEEISVSKYEDKDVSFIHGVKNDKKLFKIKYEF